MSALEAEKSVADIMAEIGRNARIAAKALAIASSEQNSRALMVAAGAMKGRDSAA